MEFALEEGGVGLMCSVGRDVIGQLTVYYRAAGIVPQPSMARNSDTRRMS